MKHIILTLTILLGICACGSAEKPQEMARAYDPILDRDDQLDRVITMIKDDKDLDNEKKNKLIELVNDQAQKTLELRMQQSQLRAVLIDQLLKGAAGSKSQTLATSKRLEKLNKKNIKELDDFIVKFRAISGERDKDQLMREAGGVHML